MDKGTKISIEKMISMAKIEVKSLNYRIDDIIQEILPYISSTIREFMEIEEKSARDLDIEFDFNDDTEQLIRTINSGLSDVKVKLSEIDFSKNEIINDSSIGLTNEVLEKIKEALKSIIRKAIIERQQKINENLLKKQKLIEEKKALEIEKATLKGKKEGIEESLERLKSKKKKEILAEKIKFLDGQIQDIDIKIKQKDFEVLSFTFKENEGVKSEEPENKENSISEKQNVNREGPF